MAIDDNTSATNAGRIKPQAGFTLLELMLTVGIIGILAAIALPNFSDMILNQRARSGASDMFSTLLFARSEAIKRNTSAISVIRTGAAWESGWSVQTLPSGGTILKQQDAYTGLTISTNLTSNTLTFGSNGRPLAGSSGVWFLIYPTSKPNSLARCVSLSLSGLPSARVDSDTDKTNGC